MAGGKEQLGDHQRTGLENNLSRNYKGNLLTDERRDGGAQTTISSPPFCYNSVKSDHTDMIHTFLDLG